MPTLKPSAAKRSAVVSKILKKKRLDSARKRTARSRGQLTLAKINSDVERDLKVAASKAEKDRAFRLFVRTALNGDTDKVTGWQMKPAEA